MHIISKFIACFSCSSEELAEATKLCDADSLQAGQACELGNTVCPKPATVWGATVPRIPRQLPHTHRAARFDLIDSPKGFGMGFIVHN